MAEQFVDDNGVTEFVDENGVTEFLDDNNVMLGGDDDHRPGAFFGYWLFLRQPT